MLRSDLPALGPVRTTIPITESWGDDLVVTTECNAPAEGWTTTVIRRWRDSFDDVITVAESEPIDLPLGQPHPEQTTVGAHAHAVEYVAAMAHADKDLRSLVVGGLPQSPFARND